MVFSLLLRPSILFFLMFLLLFFLLTLSLLLLAAALLPRLPPPPLFLLSPLHSCHICPLPLAFGWGRLLLWGQPPRPPFSGPAWSVPPLPSFLVVWISCQREGCGVDCTSLL